MNDALQGSIIMGVVISVVSAIGVVSLIVLLYVCKYKKKKKDIEEKIKQMTEKRKKLYIIQKTKSFVNNNSIKLKILSSQNSIKVKDLSNNNTFSNLKEKEKAIYFLGLLHKKNFVLRKLKVNNLKVNRSNYDTDNNFSGTKTNENTEIAPTPNIFSKVNSDKSLTILSYNSNYENTSSIALTTSHINQFLFPKVDYKKA